MLAIFAAASIGVALPPEVEPCVQAVLSSRNVAAACELPASARRLDSSLPAACRSLMQGAPSLSQSLASLADQPTMRDGLRQGFAREVSACSTAYTSPPPPAPRTTAQRIWD